MFACMVTFVPLELSWQAFPVDRPLLPYQQRISCTVQPDRQVIGL